VAEVVELDGGCSRTRRAKSCTTECSSASGDNDDHDLASTEDSGALDRLTVLVQTFDKLLEESTSGCKSWAAGTSTGSADSTGSGQAAATAVVDGAQAVEDCAAHRTASVDNANSAPGGWECPAGVGDDGGGCATSQVAGSSWTAEAKRDWWRWRQQLDQRCGEAALELQGLAGNALHAVLTRGNSTCVGKSAGGDSAVRGTEGVLPTRWERSHRAGRRAGDNSAGVHQTSALAFLLDSGLHRLPWEWLEALRDRPVFRVLHLGCLQPNGTHGQVQLVDTADAVFVVDPKGDLPGTRSRFEDWFRREPGWCGSVGAPPMQTQELQKELQQKDLFVFLGHGAGVLPQRLCMFSH
jgi:hypothetical protein